jgi:hypothetical protein
VALDELGEGVADVAVGDRVFGFSAEGAAQAELAVLSYYAPIPPSLDFPGAAWDRPRRRRARAIRCPRAEASTVSPSCLACSR